MHLLLVPEKQQKSANLPIIKPFFISFYQAVGLICHEADRRIFYLTHCLFVDNRPILQPEHGVEVGSCLRGRRQ